MRRLLSTVDRWGPAVLSVLSLFALCGMGWIYSTQIARLEGMVEARLQMEASLRMEIQTWQAYVSSLEKVMIESGLQIPERPKPLPFRKEK